MEQIGQNCVPMDDIDQIKDLLQRLGFEILLKGTKYFTHFISLTMENHPNPLQETSQRYHRLRGGIESVIEAALTKAWKTEKYWRILFAPEDLRMRPSYAKLVGMLLRWMQTNEVVYYSCPEQPLHSYTELRTKNGGFISQ